MEQAVRVHCRGESPFSMRWPCSDHWGHKLHNILIIVKALQVKVKEGTAIAAAKTEALHKKAAKFGEGQTKREEAVVAA
eukprot:14168084-Heterocapsa_arctica.AAC.1